MQMHIFGWPNNYNEVLTYFFLTYIEGAASRSPLFPVIIWNHFETASEKFRKTTNWCEGFHNALNSLFHCSHLNIGNLLKGLGRDIAFQRLLLANAQTSRPEIIKKKYDAIATKVSMVFQEYKNQEDKLRFLYISFLIIVTIHCYISVALFPRLFRVFYCCDIFFNFSFLV